MLSYFLTTSTINAMAIGYRIYDLHWYQLPRGEQFIVQMLLHRSQFPFEFKGLGIFVCSLETFLKVILPVFPIEFQKFTFQLTHAFHEFSDDPNSAVVLYAISSTIN